MPSDALKFAVDQRVQKEDPASSGNVSFQSLSPLEKKLTLLYRAKLPTRLAFLPTENLDEILRTGRLQSDKLRPTPSNPFSELAKPETAFPVLSSANKFLEGVTPTKGLVGGAINAATFPQRQVLRAGAGFIDIVDNITDSFVAGIRTAFGPKSIPFSTQLKRLRDPNVDRSSGTLQFKKELETTSGKVDELIKQGVAPEEIQKRVQSNLMNAGIRGDLAEALTVELLFRGPGAVSQAVKGTKRAKRLNELKNLRSQRKVSTLVDALPEEAPPLAPRASAEKIGTVLGEPANITPKNIAPVGQPVPTRNPQAVLPTPKNIAPVPELKPSPLAKQIERVSKKRVQDKLKPFRGQRPEGQQAARIERAKTFAKEAPFTPARDAEVQNLITSSAKNSKKLKSVSTPSKPVNVIQKSASKRFEAEIKPRTSKPAKEFLSKAEKDALMAERRKAGKAFRRKRKAAISKKNRSRFEHEQKELKKDLNRLIAEQDKARKAKEGVRVADIQDKINMIAKREAALIKAQIKDKTVVDLIDDIIGGRRGSFDPKGKNPLAGPARKELKRRVASAVARARERGQSLSNYLDDVTDLNSSDKKMILHVAKELSDNDVAEGARRVANIQVDKLQREGKISDEAADVIRKAEDQAPKAFSNVNRPRVSDKARARGTAEPDAARLADEILETERVARVSAADIPLLRIEKLAQTAKATGVSVEKTAEDFITLVADLEAMKHFLGAGLRAQRFPTLLEDYIKALRQARKTAKGANAVKLDQAIKAAEKVGLKPRSYVRRLWDAFHEYSINAILSAGRTAIANITGASIEVLIKQPVERIGRAFLTKLLPKHLVKNPVYFREVGAEIKAIYGALPQGVRLGTRFFKYENTNKVMRSMSRDAKKIMEEMRSLPKNSSKHVKLAKKLRRLLRDRRDLFKAHMGSRTEEVFRGETRVLKGPIGYAINTPVRVLVATDAVLFNSSFKGHQAAMKIMKAAKQGRTAKSLKNIKLTKKEISVARDDALEYLYRKALGNDLLGRPLTSISHTPVLNNIFPFIKTRFNILSMHLQRTPFGFIKAVYEGAKVGGIETKSASRFITGNLMAYGLWEIVKKKGGKFVSPSRSRKERKQRRGLGLPEVGIEYPDGTKIPTQSLSPVSEVIAWLSAVEQLETDKKKGRPIGRARQEAALAYFKAVIENALFSDIRGMQRWSERFSEKAADPSSPVSVNFNKETARFISSRIVPNILRETKQSGKILGVPSPVKKDPTVTEIDESNPVKAILQQIKGDIPGLDKDVPRKLSPLTGDPVKRLDRFTPINPKFYTQKGKVVGKDISEKEARVRKELLDTKASVLAPKRTTKGLTLTSQEIRDMTRFVAKGPGNLPPLLVTLDKLISSRGYQNVSDPVLREKAISKITSDYYSIGYKRARMQAIKRLRQTLEGRKTLWEAFYKGNRDFKDDPKELRKVILFLQ